MFLNLFIWINGSAPVYWSTCVLALAALLFSIVACGRRSFSPGTGATVTDIRPASRAVGWGFIGLMAITVLIFRWPILFYQKELNVDESQMASQAMKYFLDFIPWRSVDGTTSGPLNSWLLMIPALFGFEISYTSGRVMGMLCIFATLGFTYATFRVFTSEFYSRVAVLPMVLFYAFTRGSDFTHYTSEHLPVMLMAGGIYFGVAALSGAQIGLRALFGSALCFGALPWAKFQAGPVGFFGVLALMVAVVLKTKDWRASFRPVALCAAGGLCTAVAIMALVIPAGAFADFVISYLGLVQHHEHFMMPPDEIIGFLTTGPHAFVYFVCGILFSAGALIYLRVRGQIKLMEARRPLFWFAGYLLVCVFIVFKAGRSYPHYALFLVHPLGLFCGGLLFAIADAAGKRAAAAEAEPGGSRSGSTWVGVAPALVFGGLFLLVQTGRKAVADADYLSTGIVEKHREPPRSQIVESIRRHCPRGERMVIWGWNPRYYVLTGLIQGTRDAIAQMAMFDDYPHHAYYQRRFLEDMKESKPAVFLDTDARNYPPGTRRERPGHEKFPELAEYVRPNYRLMYELAVPDYEETIRIYFRNDLVEE